MVASSPKPATGQVKKAEKSQKKPESAVKKPEVSTGKKLVRMVRHKSSKEQQRWIDYAFAECGKECVLTWTAESGWVSNALNTGNKDGTSDKGLCQLNSKYHKAFLRSQEFHNPYKQIDYCVLVWKDALKRPYATSCGKTPWCGYNVRNTPGIIKQFDFIYE